MAYTTIVAGTTITAAWANASVRDQTVSPFADAAARTSAVASPIEGMPSVLTGVDRFEIYDGSAYQRVGWYSTTGRTGGTWSRVAAQSINNVTITAVSFDTETVDSDGFLTPTSSTLTIPSGLGGLYSITAAVSYSTAAIGVNMIRIVAGGVNYDVAGTPVTGIQALGFVVPLAATNTVQVQTYHTFGSALNIGASLNVYRKGA